MYLYVVDSSNLPTSKSLYLYVFICAARQRTPIYIYMYTHIHVYHTYVDIGLLCMYMNCLSSKEENPRGHQGVPGGSLELDQEPRSSACSTATLGPRKRNQIRYRLYIRVSPSYIQVDMISYMGSTSSIPLAFARKGRASTAARRSTSSLCGRLVSARLLRRRRLPDARLARTLYSS